MPAPALTIVCKHNHDLVAEALPKMEQMRASVDPVLARGPNLTVSAMGASNHSKVLCKDFQAAADAVRELAAARSTPTAQPRRPSARPTPSRKVS